MSIVVRELSLSFSWWWTLLYQRRGHVSEWQPCAQGRHLPLRDSFCVVIGTVRSCLVESVPRLHADRNGGTDGGLCFVQSRGRGGKWWPFYPSLIPRSLLSHLGAVLYGCVVYSRKCRFTIHRIALHIHKTWSYFRPMGRLRRARCVHVCGRSNCSAMLYTAQPCSTQLSHALYSSAVLSTA